MGMMIKPRDYQSAAATLMWNDMMSGHNAVTEAATGAGKSIIIALLAKMALSVSGRAIVLAHRKELLTQNAKAFSKVAPGRSYGFYSAGLKKKQSNQDVIFAGIQSAWKHAAKLGSRQMVLIDECHRIPMKDEGMYRAFINDMRDHNSVVCLGGFSATPFRTNEGAITEGDLFDKVSFQIGIKELLERGYLTPLTVPDQPVVNFSDMSGCLIRGKDFDEKQMSDLFIEKAEKSVAEMIAYCKGRKKIVVFASSIAHAELITKMVEEITGDMVALVHGGLTPLERETQLQAFSSGFARWMVNMNVLVEGWDEEKVDAVVLKRASTSPIFLAQAVGRGLRLFSGKPDCLVLDFGQNFERHGPLDSPDFGVKDKPKAKAKDKDDEEEKPTEKECVGCKCVVPIQTQTCPNCGEWLGTASDGSFQDYADTDAAPLSDMSKAIEKTVDSCCYSLHTKKDDPSKRTLRLDIWYTGKGGKQACVSEFWCVEHPVGTFAWNKWKGHWHEVCAVQDPEIEGTDDGYQNKEHQWVSLPMRIEVALEMIERGAVRYPTKIKMMREGRYWRVVDKEYEDERPTQLSEHVEEIPF